MRDCIIIMLYKVQGEAEKKIKLAPYSRSIHARDVYQSLSLTLRRSEPGLTFQRKTENFIQKFDISRMRMIIRFSSAKTFPKNIVKFKNHEKYSFELLKRIEEEAFSFWRKNFFAISRTCGETWYWNQNQNILSIFVIYKKIKSQNIKDKIYKSKLMSLLWN